MDKILLGNPNSKFEKLAAVESLLEEKDKALQETDRRRELLLKEMNVLWAADQYRIQYDKANERDDVRGALTALNSLFDKLKLFERQSTEILSKNAEKWSPNDPKQIQLDLAKHAVLVGDTHLAARMAESLSKYPSDEIDSFDFESHIDEN